MTLADALARARAHNPAILAARLARPVSAAGIDVARERPNPELSYEAARETPRQSIGAALPIELGGKRQRRISLANAGVAAADAGTNRAIADVDASVRHAYFGLMAAEARVAIAAGLRDLAARARDAAEARFSAGEVPRLDAVQAELTFTGAENDATAARGEADAARAELNVLLGDPPESPVVTAALPASAALPSLTDAIAQAARTNGDIVLLDRQIEEQAARLALAAAMRVPDASVGSAVTWDAEPEFRVGWRIDFGVTLPLLTQHRAGVTVESAELTRLRAERASALAALTGSLASALARAAAAREQLDRYTTEALPRAVEVEQMAQDGYAAGQTNLVTLLQVLQSARETRRRGVDIQLEYQNALADLERALGTPVLP
jgi:cobalt-zinc-cadmium efflux system outer membrane protein